MRTPRVFQDERDQIDLTAGAALTALKDTFVKTNAAGAVIAATAGGTAIGVLRNAPASGAVAQVQIRGIAAVNAEEGITAGDPIMVGAAAGAKIATTGNLVVGYAVETSLISTDVRVLLVPGTAKDPDIAELLAGADLSLLTGHWMSTDAAGDVIAAVAGENVLGILLNAPTVGLAAYVQRTGIVVLTAEEAITAKDFLMVGTTNAEVLIATATNVVVGVAIDSALITADVKVLLGNQTVL